MASSPLPSPLPAPLPLLSDHSLDLASVRLLIARVNRHFNRFLSDPAARRALHLSCGRALAVSHNAYFDFSDQSVLSNLYWGIDNVEAALLPGISPAHRASRLAASEKMLQMPALLDEEGSTAGVHNRYLVCCAYFYLALARKLSGDQWQMIMHLLHSLLVSPSCFRKELAPALWRSLFSPSSSSSSAAAAIGVDDEIARQHVKKYKDWLMYYQVVSYGETPPWTRGSSDDEFGDSEPESKYGCTICASARCFNSLKQVPPGLNFPSENMVYALNVKDAVQVTVEATTSISEDRGHFTEKDDTFLNLDMSFSGERKENFDIRCLQEMLDESQSDSPVSFYSHNPSSDEESDLEERARLVEYPAVFLSMSPEVLASNTSERNHLAECLQYEPVSALPLESPGYCVDKKDYEVNASCLSFRRSPISLEKYSVLDLKNVETSPIYNYHAKARTSPVRSPINELRCFRSFSSTLPTRYNLSELISGGSFIRRRKNYSTGEKDWSDENSIYGKDNQVEFFGIFEKTVSNICFQEDQSNHEDADLEITTIWQLLKKKNEVKHSRTKQQILDKLLEIISASKKENIIRESVSILLLLISEDKTIIQDIKKKDTHLCNLASALKRNVHEAAIVIYLLNPSPSEIRNLELLPALVEVACSPGSHTKESVVLPLTPSSASMAMIEILVTAFDYVTNNMHLSAISSPKILSKLVNVAMYKNLEEGVALAAILVRCMHLNGNCKKFLSQFTPVEPFLHLLRSNEKRSKFAALQYFHEILQIPRASGIHLLHQIWQQRSISIMHSLVACIRQTELEHQLMAANLLLQLDMLEQSSGRSVFKEEAMEVLLEAIGQGKSSRIQILAASILSNIGGTYSWTGEPYTAPWLLKRAGLTSTCSRNMIKNIDWLDPCLQDTEINAWSSKAARSIIKMGGQLFDALEKGIQSKTKIVSHGCLVFLAWLGSEIAIMGSTNDKYSFESLSTEIAQFLSPGSDLEDRILSCICVYNYTSGKGKKKLMNFTEGIRESLRRLSSFTWMAEELLRVTDYFLPTKPRVSCVHTQIVEVGQVSMGAATALIFFKGQLCVGHSDGSIRVWDINCQKSLLLWEVKEHKKAVTCFVLSESGDSIISGSSDKTIRLWKMAQRKLECIEMIEMKEPIQKLETYGNTILIVTCSRGLKVCNASRSFQTLCKSKQIKCFLMAREKVYLGCSDSSILEIDLSDGNKTVIRPPVNSWRIHKKPINAIKLYKDWMYSAGSVVEGSCIKNWKKHWQPQISIHTTVQAMEVVEDFIYLNCISSRSTVQIWLRGQQQKVGRLAAGCKVTSLLWANDIIFCGTENGLIKGWIPL